MLPADLQHRLAWRVAAAVRPATADPDADRAIAEATNRHLGAHDEGDRIEAVATRLAAAIDAGYARRGFLRGVHLTRNCKTSF